MSEEKKKNHSLKDKFKNLKLFNKLKKVKHIEYIIAFTFLAVILMIYFSSSSFFSFSNKKSSNSSIKFINGLDYANTLENKLSHILSNIKGAGKVDVMVNVESGGELILAYEVEEKKIVSSSGNETITTIKNPIILNNGGKNEPLVLMTMLPKITGVIIVCSGANEIGVKLNMISAIQGLLTISNEKIQIFEGEI